MKQLPGRDQRRPLPLPLPFLWLAGAAIVLLAALVALVLGYLRAQAIESGERLTASFALVIEEQTTRTLQTIDQRLQLAAIGLAQLEATRGLSEESARVLLRQQLGELPFVRSIWVLDAQGRMVHDSNEGNIGVSFADQPYFQVYLQSPRTGFYIGAPVLSRTSGLWAIMASRPLRGAGDVFAGVVVAAIDPTYFDRLWRAIDLGPGGSIALFQRTGVLLMRSPFEEASMGKSFVATPLFSQYLLTKPVGDYHRVSSIDGVMRTFSYRTLAARPELVVVVGQSMATMLAPWRQFAQLVLIICALAAAALLASGVLANRARRDERRAAVVLRQSEARLRNVVDGFGPGVFVGLLTLEGRVVLANQSVLKAAGLKLDDVLGQLVEQTPWFADSQAVHQRLREAVQLAAAGTPSRFDMQIRGIGETDLIWIDFSIQSVLDAAGQVAYLVPSALVIQERKMAEVALNLALEEKTALLNEVHHRVKNNLQVVTSLLRLEAGRSGHAETKAVLVEMQGRIRAMALLHESIYRSGSFASIDLGDYLKQIATQAFRSLVSGERIDLRLMLGSVQVGLDQATPCGLLVSELISNALKHAFPEQRGGVLCIELKALAEAGHWSLRISDDGVGLPADFEARQQDSLGLQLVASLAEQMGGRLDIGPGALFVVTFEVVAPSVVAMALP